MVKGPSKHAPARDTELAKATASHARTQQPLKMKNTVYSVGKCTTGWQSHQQQYPAVAPAARLILVRDKPGSCIGSNWLEGCDKHGLQETLIVHAIKAMMSCEAVAPPNHPQKLLCCTKHMTGCGSRTT